MGSEVPQHAIEQLKQYNEVMKLRQVLNELLDRGVYFPFMRIRLYDELNARAMNSHSLLTPTPETASMEKDE